MTEDSVSAPAELLTEHAGLLRALAPGRALDVACGDGRNTLLAASLGLRAVGIDRDAARLAAARAEAARRGLRADFVRADLEDPAAQPEAVLRPAAFAAVLVFRYLHRPLLPLLRAAVAPGGLIFYETYTLAQRAFGKPRNPDFLLGEGELAEAFAGYEVLHRYEGVLEGPRRAMARLIARRPMD